MNPAVSPPVSPSSDPEKCGQPEPKPICGCNLDDGSSDEYHSADEEGYQTADSEEAPSPANASAASSSCSLRLLASGFKDELLPGTLDNLAVKNGNPTVKQHPTLLVPFVHALEEQCPELTGEQVQSIDAVFRIPIVRGVRASKLNTWQSIQISSLIEAEGLVLLSAAARAAIGLSYCRQSMAGCACFQNLSCRRVVMTEKPPSAFLAGVLGSEDNVRLLKWIARAASLQSIA